MKSIIFLAVLILSQMLEETDFGTVMKSLGQLENYIKLYIQEKSSTETFNHLLSCYIREGAYTGNAWEVAGGTIPSDLPQYIIDKDSAQGTSAQLCKTYREIVLPTNEKIDFVHFFAVMNGIEHGNSFSGDFANLVGWGGDTSQLLKDIKDQTGDLDALIAIAKTFFRKKGGFGEADFISDLDAPIILNKKTDANNFANIIQEYYNGKDYLKRINNFVKLTFPGLNDTNKFREEIFSKYSSNFYIKILECQDGIRDKTMTCYLPGEIKSQYVLHQKAAVYVVSDYLAENFVPDPKPEPDHSDDHGDDSDKKNFSFYLHSTYIMSILSFIILMV